MAQKSLKINDLAKKMKCSAPTISSWRSGTIPSAMETQRLLAKVLDINVEELIYGKNKAAVFSNSKNFADKALRLKITKKVEQILDDAESVEGGLEHFYMELALRFPQEIYKNSD